MKKGWYSACLLFGLAAAWLVVDHIAGFSPHEYFFRANPGIEKYSGVNVVSRWADLSFFTYHTVILFALWTVGLFLSFAIRIPRLRTLCTHEATVTLVLTNYILTAVLATAFELAGGNPTFGLYANHNAAWHNFGTNILAHYVFPVFALTVASRIRTVGRLTKTHVHYFLAYLLLYFVAVRLTGMLCYRIEWYPYPIFDPELLWQMLGLPAYTPALG